MLALAFAVAAATNDASRFIGSTIALYNVAEQRFIRMSPGDRQTRRPDTCTDMDRSGIRADPNTMPKSWNWEKFKVVDGGNGTVGLYNIVHRRFVRMPPSLGHMDVSIVLPEPKLPDNYGWERFELVEAPDAPGEYGLWHPGHERFVTMSPDVSWLESSKKRVVFQYTTRSWPEERFRLIKIEEPLAGVAGGEETGAEELADDEPQMLNVADAERACPHGFSPQVYALLAAMFIVTLCSVIVAVVAVVCACKHRRAAVAKLSAPMPMAVAPLPPAHGVALMTESERRQTAI